MTETAAKSTQKARFDLEQVRVSYNHTTALEDITLSIHDGEIVALIGPSGAGKTTLLKKLYELDPSQCAFVHQHYALVPQLSALHNVFMGRLDRNTTLVNLINLLRPQRHVKAEIKSIFETLSLEDKIHTRIEALSGGQQQRVAVGRALYRGGQVLLADEPVSSIDPLQGEAILKLIIQSGKTVIMALHSVAFAKKFARRIIGLRNGRIQFDRPAPSVSPAEIADLLRPC